MAFQINDQVTRSAGDDAYDYSKWSKGRGEGDTDCISSPFSKGARISRLPCYIWTDERCFNLWFESNMSSGVTNSISNWLSSVAEIVQRLNISIFDFAVGLSCNDSHLPTYFLRKPSGPKVLKNTLPDPLLNHLSSWTQNCNRIHTRSMSSLHLLSDGALKTNRTRCQGLWKLSWVIHA